MRDPHTMTTEEIHADIEELGKQWDDLRDGECDHAGSPGEWIIERLMELESEYARRAKS